MKKKYRDIVVNNENHAWSVSNNNDGDRNNYITVWKDKKVIFYNHYMRGDINITPEIISELIKNRKHEVL